MVETSNFHTGRAILAGLVGVTGHAVVVGAAYLAGILVSPSDGGGMRDLAAVVATFLLAQIVLGLTCLIGGSVLFVRGRTDLGLGVVAGWLAGGVATWLLIRAGS